MNVIVFLVFFNKIYLSLAVEDGVLRDTNLIAMPLLPLVHILASKKIEFNSLVREQIIFLSFLTKLINYFAKRGFYRPCDFLCSIP